MQNIDDWEEDKKKKRGYEFSDRPDFNETDFLLADNSRQQKLDPFDETDPNDPLQEIISDNPEYDDHGFIFPGKKVKEGAVKLFDDDPKKGESDIFGRLPKKPKKEAPFFGPADMTEAESKVSQALARANKIEKEALEKEDSAWESGKSESLDEGEESAGDFIEGGDSKPTMFEEEDIKDEPQAQLGSSESRDSEEESEGDEPFDWKPFEGNLEFGPQEKREKGKIDWMPWGDDKEFGPQEKKDGDGLSDQDRLSLYEKIMKKLNSGTTNDTADWGQIAEQVARSRSVAKGGKGVDVGFYDMLRNRGKDKKAADRKEALAMYLQQKKDAQKAADREYKVGRDNKTDKQKSEMLQYLKDKFGATEDRLGRKTDADIALGLSNLETKQGQIGDKSDLDWANLANKKIRQGVGDDQWREEMGLKKKIAETKKATPRGSRRRYTQSFDPVTGERFVLDTWEQDESAPAPSVRPGRNQGYNLEDDGLEGDSQGYTVRGGIDPNRPLRPQPGETRPEFKARVTKKYKGKKPPTEGQGKANAQYTRMQDAAKQLDEVGDISQKSLIALKQQQTQNALWDSPGGMLLEATGITRRDQDSDILTPDEQIALQAQRVWAEAFVRSTSGAVIGEKELTDEEVGEKTVGIMKTYFPQLGDSPATIKRKKDSRAIAMKSVGEKGTLKKDKPKEPKQRAVTRVSNGKETREIDIDDLPAAIMDGYKEVR